VAVMKLVRSPQTLGRSHDLTTLPVAALLPPAWRIRERTGDLGELADSIRGVGVLLPLIVVPCGSDRYEIVCGLRRWQAAQKAGLSAVPCLVRDLAGGERVEAMLVENLQRSTLTRLEEARGYQELIQLGYSHRAIAARVGRSAAHICRRLRLLALPPAIQGKVEKRQTPVNAALGYQRRPSDDIFASDEKLHRAWLALRSEIIGQGDSVLVHLLAVFAEAFVDRVNLIRPSTKRMTSSGPPESKLDSVGREHRGTNNPMLRVAAVAGSNSALREA
jgi:ParB/RepB/Spo0J family partition protein